MIITSIRTRLHLTPTPHGNCRAGRQDDRRDVTLLARCVGRSGSALETSGRKENPKTTQDHARREKAKTKKTAPTVWCCSPPASRVRARVSVPRVLVGCRALLPHVLFPSTLLPTSATLSVYGVLRWCWNNTFFPLPTEREESSGCVAAAWKNRFASCASRTTATRARGGAVLPLKGLRVEGSEGGKCGLREQQH